MKIAGKNNAAPRISTANVEGVWAQEVTLFIFTRARTHTRRQKNKNKLRVPTVFLYGFLLYSFSIMNLIEDKTRVTKTRVTKTKKHESLILQIFNLICSCLKTYPEIIITQH